MEQLITFDNLLSAALLKFEGVVDNKDLIILIDMLKRENIFLEDNSFKKLKKNDYESWGIHELQNCNDLDSEKIRIELDAKQGIILKEFLENLDLKELVLRKISPRIYTNVVYHTYSNVLVKQIKQLNLEGFIDNALWRDNARIFTITYKGEAYLFIKDNPELVNSFINIIINHGLDVGLLNDFILDTYPKCKYHFNVLDYQNYCLQKTKECEIVLAKRKEFSLASPF